jgi:Ca2+-binding RTX toxin-like protein
VLRNNATISNNISLNAVSEIRVWGRAGNDKISVLLVDRPFLIHGGAGNDDIVGGSHADLLFGGLGTDTLLGGLGHDLLVGGGGSDTIVSAQGDDILVGGQLSAQLSDKLLRTVLEQWEGAIQNAEFENSLIDDNAVDSMFDSLGDDWFTVGEDDLALDLNPWDADVVTNH